MKRIYRVFALRTVGFMILLIGGSSLLANESSLKIHMLSGSAEYKSDLSLARWSKMLTEQGHHCTIATSVKTTQEISQLKDCDLLVIFCKRWKLNEEELAHIKAAVTTKPILGIRTASHAFQTWLAFDNEVLGGTYSGHGGNGEVTVMLHEANKRHPVLAGLEQGWTRQGKIYFNPAIARGKSGSPQGKFKADNIVLMQVQDKKNQPTPATWVRENPGGQRVFYTSLGFVHDFEDSRFLRLLSNAILWTTNQKTANSN